MLLWCSADRSSYTGRGPRRYVHLPLHRLPQDYCKVLNPIICVGDVILTDLSMFASNFIVKDTHLKHTRGEDKLTRFRQKNTIATGNYMENSFCSVCGTLMYRRSSGYPGASIPRIGTIDDYKLQETVFKPRVEVRLMCTNCKCDKY